MTTPITRRTLITAAGVGTLTLTASGCGILSTDPDVDEGHGSTEKGPEAPELAARVEAGELPPVEERLPVEPLVIEPIEEIGRYGGTWRTSMIGQDDTSWLAGIVGYEPFVRWAREWTNSADSDEILPNICESFEELEGGSVFEFKLREGMRWSDGEPVTVEDARFTFEDCNSNPEFHPFGVYEMWTNPSDGSPATFEQVDDWTIRYIFDGPKPGWLHEQCRNRLMVLPSHYLKQFHIYYNDDAQELAEDEGFDDWIALSQHMRDTWLNAELPTLHAWKVVRELGDGDAVTLERNPYYWKVDPDGSQLPYVDNVRAEILLDEEVQLLQVTNGDLDLQMNHFNTIRNLPIVTNNAEDNDYRLFEVGPGGTNAVALAFNQTLHDHPLAELFRNKDFRIGVSHAIDRQEVIESVFAGQSIPWQVAPLEDQAGYDEEAGTQYTEYSTDLANEHLDRAGLTERSSNGTRLFEGTPVEITVLVNAGATDQIDAMELITPNLAEVGIGLNVSPVADTLFWERVEANQSECSAFGPGLYEPRPTMGSNHYWVPSNPRGGSMWGHDWAIWWRSGGEDGAEPPEAWRRSLELFEELLVTYDGDRAEELNEEILAIAKEQFPWIGICTQPTSYGVARNHFRNVPDYFPGEGIYTAPGPSNPEHYFFADES